MKAYDQLAPTYNIIFDNEERLKREDPFFEHLFQEHMATSILDLGCGAGGHSLYWSEKGMNVVGIDSSAGMIAEARSQAEAQGLDVEFQCIPITDFSSKLQQRFNAVVCLGNTVAHLLQPEQLGRLLRETVACLKVTGVAVFHCVNFRRILDIKRRDHPVLSRTVEGKEYVFCRFYDFHPHALEFNMVLLAKEDGAWTSHSSQILHYPWMKEDLETLAKDAGFTDVMFYGGMDFSDFDPEKSADLFMVCELGGEE